MSEIRTWLDGIGLAQYANAFEANDIDIDLLGQVDDQVLKDIGVSSAGHRLRIRNAIARLRPTLGATTGTELEEAKASVADHPLGHTRDAEQAQASGERRHVTVMFCDLVDSTGIAAGLDAEEWRDLVGGYLDAASAAVTDVGGRVAKKLGDGLMALFGYPLAQENDAERAARAALAIQRALAELNRRNADTGKPALAARIAIDSGPVVVDAMGEIFGDLPNIAARAQALAEPGSVVVTARVQRQVAGLFVAEERGSHQLKGVPEPVTLFRIVRASGAGRRAGQRHLTPLVGRDEEIGILTRRWERARQGDGQLVLIVGEPGLGKSRLIEEFHSQLRETPHTWVEWSCSQLLQNTPLHPIVEWGRQRFGGADVPAKQRLADLESTLTQVKLDSAESASLLAPLLDIPLSSERSVELVPEELRRRQMAALTNWVMAGARAQPIVLAIEDAHWADPTTLELLRGIAERGALAPLLVVITARPEFRPAWGVRSHHATISLVPLDREQVRQMVGGLTARHALSKEVVKGVTERTGGVPLFVEELTRLLLERGEQGGVQAIPPTLQQSLTARLDRLGSAREVAQIGAVIGRDFSYALLRAVAGMEDTPLQLALERLAEADILLVQGLPPSSEYRFKHALIQDAAYENLLKSRRQLLHRRIAEGLRDQFTESGAAEPELLAHHFTQAGLTEAAIEWWGKAGQRSVERSALVEAIEQLTRALDQIAILPATLVLRREQIRLQVALIHPLVHVKGYAAPETKAALERARLLIEEAEALGEPPEDPMLLFEVLYGFGVASYTPFNADINRDLAVRFLTLTEKQGAIVPLMIGHRLMGGYLTGTGNFAQGRAHYDRAIALYDPAQHRQLSMRFGADARVSVLSLRSWALWSLGYPEAALIDADRALGEAREIGQAGTLMYALSIASLPYLQCGNYAKAKAIADELVLLADEKGALQWKALGLVNRGLLAVLTGGASEAVQVLASGIDARRSTGATVWLPLYLSYLHCRVPSTQILKRRYSFQHSEVEIVACFVYLNSRNFLGMLSTSRLWMKARAHAETITATDAESACVQGDEAKLSQYLRQAKEPSPNVIQSIVAALFANLPGSDPGPGNLRLDFSPRNGRPPKHQPEITSAAVAIAHGQAIPLGQYLRAIPSLDDDTRGALADAFDPNPAAPSKWQLKYAHARRGFPCSSLHTELEDARLGSAALSVYEEDGKPWKQVYYEVDGEHASPTRIKKGVAKVRKARQLLNKKPLD